MYAYTNMLLSPYTKTSCLCAFVSKRNAGNAGLKWLYTEYQRLNTIFNQNRLFFVFLSPKSCILYSFALMPFCFCGKNKIIHFTLNISCCIISTKLNIVMNIQAKGPKWGIKRSIITYQSSIIIWKWPIATNY
jgi:hypothetical protein